MALNRGSYRAIAALAAVMAASAVATSCDALQDDAYPYWLPYLESGVDMASLAAEAGIGSIRNIVRLEYAPFSSGGADLSKVLAYVSGVEGDALFALDAGSLELGASWRRGSVPPLSRLNPVIKATINGFLSGGLEFSPANLEAEPLVIAPGMPPKDSWAFSGELPAYNFIVGNHYANPISQLTIAAYDEALALAAPLASATRRLDAEGSYLRVIDAEFISDRYRVLVATDSGGYVFSYADAADLLAPGPLRLDAEAEVTGPFPLSDDMAWLTSGGVVALVRDKETRLERYRYGAPSAALDSLSISDTEGYSFLSFDPSGTWWFLFDRVTGRLYKLRTWWLP